MKRSLVFSILVGGATARRSAFDLIRHRKQLRLLMSVKDGSFLDAAESLEPTLDWEDSTEFGDIVVRYGVKAATSLKDGAERTAWASATTETDNGWTVSAKGDLDLNDRSNVDLELDVLNSDVDTSIGLDASITDGDGLNVKFAELHKKAETNLFDKAGSVDLKARYTFADGKTEVEIDYESEGTTAEIVASTDAKSLKLSRRVGDFLPFLKDAKYSVTISDQDDNTYQYERIIDADGKLTASLRVNDQAEVEWKDNGWIASAKAKLDGIQPVNPEVNIRREVAF